MKRTLSFILSIVLVISVFMVSERDVKAKTVKKSGYYYTVLRGKKSRSVNIWMAGGFQVEKRKSQKKKQ